MTEYVDTQIEKGVFERMQKHSIPLTDTVSSVITRLLDYYEPQASKEGAIVGGPGNAIECDPASPPSLRHTVPEVIKVNGVELPYPMRYWNNLMIEVIRIAAGKVSNDELYDLVIVNKAKGEKTGNNFNYIKEAGLSVQLQNSVAAWKATYQIASKLGIEVEVTFHWNIKDNAAHPGRRGHLKI